MIDCTVDIPGTDYKIALVELDTGKKEAKILGIKKPSGTVTLAKKIKGLKAGMCLDIVEGYFTVVERFGENQVTLAIGKKSDEFAIEDGDTNVLGYATSHVNTVLPDHLVLANAALSFRKPFLHPKKNLENTYYQIFYDSQNEEIQLQYKGEVSDELQPFNPHKNINNFVVRDNVSAAKWTLDNPETGIKFDATGSGDVDSPDDYVVINDFYIKQHSSLMPKSFAVFPTKIIGLTVGNVCKIRGIKFFTTSVSEKRVMMVPIFERTIFAAIPTEKVKFSSKAKETLKNEKLSQIIELRRWVNLAFKDEFGFEPLKNDEKNANDLGNPCNSEEDFNNRIGSLNNLIDLMDKKRLLEKIGNDNANETPSIIALESFIEHKFRGNYNKSIIENLRLLKRLRMKWSFHKDSVKFYKTVKSLGFNPADIEWCELWDASINLYVGSLTWLHAAVTEISEAPDK